VAVIRRPTWKNAVAFTLYPVIGFAMFVACTLFLIVAWPVSLFADFDKAESEAEPPEVNK
jgi:hypothetical protein